MAKKARTKLPREAKPRLEAKLKSATERLKRLAKDDAKQAEARATLKKVKRAQRSLRKMKAVEAKRAAAVKPEIGRAHV